jgi:hypothetical protein
MEKKRHRGRTPEMDRALDAGYRASRTLGTALRRASDLTPNEIHHELQAVNGNVEQALFDLEDVCGVEGSIDESISECGAFLESCRKALPSAGEEYSAMLSDSVNEMECALEGLSLLVDGYHSFKEDDI